MSYSFGESERLAHKYTNRSERPKRPVSHLFYWAVNCNLITKCKEKSIIKKWCHSTNNTNCSNWKREQCANRAFYLNGAATFRFICRIATTIGTRSITMFDEIRMSGECVRSPHTRSFHRCANKLMFLFLFICCLLVILWLSLLLLSRHYQLGASI